MAIDFELEVTGLEETQAYLDAAPAMVKKTLAEAVNIIGLHIVERSRVNAPIKIVQSGDALTSEVTVEVGYAFRMHEFLTPFGPLQLGPGSRREAAAVNAPEGGVGGKFVERVIFFHTNTYITYLRDILEENLGSMTDTIRLKPHLPRIPPS